MNSGSVTEWLLAEADMDQNLNRQDMTIGMYLTGSELTVEAQPTEGVDGLFDFGPQRRLFPDFYKASLKGNIDAELGKSIVALISHDEMKPRMLDFVTDYEHELRKFRKILATGTTGRLIQEAAPSLASRVYRYHSGPKGGDVEIATEILFGGCHVVIFFVDPLHPHPHTEDIRVVFGACMINDQVRMLSNEVQARDWMDRIVRGRRKIEGGA
jgi:methylglyoxal synthase